MLPDMAYRRWYPDRHPLCLNGRAAGAERVSRDQQPCADPGNLRSEYNAFITLNAINLAYDDYPFGVCTAEWQSADGRLR